MVCKRVAFTKMTKTTQTATRSGVLDLAGVKRACPNKVMAHIWFIHDAHLGHAFLFFDMLAEYTLLSRIVYFLSSLRGQTAKTLICTKSGVSADSRKSAEKCRKVRRTALFAHFLYTFCAKSAVLRTFRHFSALFLESAETPLFVQINVFAVWPLRLDRKYTSQGHSWLLHVSGM